MMLFRMIKKQFKLYVLLFYENFDLALEQYLFYQNYFQMSEIEPLFLVLKLDW